MTSKNKPNFFLEIRNLNKKFDDFLANNDISLHIGEGEIHALLGHTICEIVEEELGNNKSLI